MYIDVSDLINKIQNKANIIRDLKKEKSDKALIQTNVNELLQFKQEYLDITGTPFDQGSISPKKSESKPVVESAVKNKPKPIESSVDNLESVVITTRGTDYSAWYTDVISAADMVDQSPVRGCMVIKPWGMGVWDLLRAEFDERIRESGTQNAYFPLLIPKSFLAKEAEHVDGFAKECAVVTHHRLCTSPDGKDLIPDPDAKLDEPLIIRPTSETVIWYMFGKWIKSYRDLPLKINQWANVIRWEMRTRPFLRSAEFLWQEGHTAHATAKEAIETAEEMLDMYAEVCKDMLAIPVVKGKKSPSERFAG
jgi:prolyl-tRNA synthetase